MLRKWITPDFLVAHVSELPPAWFAERGIQAIVSDLDNTLVAHREDAITREISHWLEELKTAGIGVCLASNTRRLARLGAVARNLGVAYVPYNCGKPGVRGLQKALSLLGTVPKETAMVGDQLFTDIVGGNRLGMTTILVNPLSPHDFIGTRLISRRLERWVLRGSVTRPNS